MLTQYLDVAPEVAQALKAGQPVVALESTIISHGMPYPKTSRPPLKWNKRFVIMALFPPLLQS